MFEEAYGEVDDDEEGKAINSPSSTYERYRISHQSYKRFHIISNKKYI